MLKYLFKSNIVWGEKVFLQIRNCKSLSLTIVKGDSTSTNPIIKGDYIRFENYRRLRISALSGNSFLFVQRNYCFDGKVREIENSKN